jgi:pyruvate formate-lyase activating enzyme-like uncharacterized protein
MPRRKKDQTRVIIDTMVMKAIALAFFSQRGLRKKHNTAMSVYQKITRETHTVILSNQLAEQYYTKMEQNNVPVDYFLNFFQNILEARNQLKRISDNSASEMQVHVRLPSEDVFLAQIAMASNPSKFNVFIISAERGIYTKDRQLQRKHHIRALTPLDYSTQYC